MAVVVGVDVDETGRDDAVARVDHFVPGRRDLADPGYSAVNNFYVGFVGLGTAAVDEQTAADENWVGHGVS